jgi:SAM-dependent methyltransferase
LLGYLLRIVVGIIKLPRINFHLRRIDRDLQASVTDLHGQIKQLSSRLEVVSAAFPQLVESASSTQTAIRMLRRERLREPGTVAPAGITTSQCWIDPQIEVVAERKLRRDKPVTWNRMPRLSDWSVGGALSARMTELNEPHAIHRKMWEYAICIDALTDFGVVTPDAVGLAVGAGSERPLYFFANAIRRMVATDLYDNALHEGTPVMLTSPASFAPFAYREDHLQVMRMSGDELAFEDDSFDFAFCLSSIEHFGSRDTQQRAFREMGRVVKPGGIVCIITELVLNGEKHHEYFTPSEIWETFLQDPVLQLVGPLDMRISESLIPLAADVRVPADLASSPHIVLTDGRVLWTSLSLFFRKR